MKGVVLAAGVGSRLRPITDAKPKCLVKAAGKAILDYQLDAYRRAGIRSVCLVVGYRADAIRRHLESLDDLDVTIIENVDFAQTNNMYSLYLVRDQVAGEPFILNNADLAIDPVIVERMLSSAAPDLVAVDASCYLEESMKVTVNPSGYIDDISKAISQAAAHACSIDFYKFSAQSSRLFFDEVTRIVEREENRRDWTEVAMQRMFRDQRLMFRPLDIAGLNWVEIDNFDDLAIADRRFSRIDAFAKRLRTVFLDLDGTVYLGSSAIPGVPPTIEGLQRSGVRVFFLTNNSSRSKSEYVQKLAAMGIACSENDVISSYDAVLGYLMRRQASRLFVMGTKALRDVFAAEGFEVDADSPEVIVLGYDTELTYAKLRRASELLNADVELIATHRDIFCPTERGPVPDAGSMIEMLRLTTGRSPSKIFGKPSAEMAADLLALPGVDPATTLVVGDRLHTDIALAANIGCESLLVLSGETSRAMLDQSDGPQPSFVLRSLADWFDSKA